MPSQGIDRLRLTVLASTGWKDSTYMIRDGGVRL